MVMASEGERKKKMGERVTPTNDTLGALKFRHQYIKITKESAQFIMHRISNVYYTVCC